MADPPLLDVRPEPAFNAGHASDAVGIPMEELSARVHELPESRQPLRVFDVDPSRVNRAADFLRGRGHLVEIASIAELSLTEIGLSRSHLWRPTAFLVEALNLIRASDTTGHPPAPRALDIACGTGRDAVYLALHGFEVTAIDLLPDAIERATDLARRSGVQVSARVQNLQRDTQVPAHQFHLVSVFRYLQRSLFPTIRTALAPGGFVIYETFHERNRETGRRPLNSDHLLRDGELRSAFAGFEILIDRDGIERDGRFFSSLLARAPR